MKSAFASVLVLIAVLQQSARAQAVDTSSAMRILNRRVDSLFIVRQRIPPVVQKLIPGTLIAGSFRI